MDVKELKALVNAIPEEQNDFPVFAQSPVDLHVIEDVQEGQNCFIVYTK